MPPWRDVSPPRWQSWLDSRLLRKSGPDLDLPRHGTGTGGPSVVRSGSARRYDPCMEPMAPEEIPALLARLTGWESVDDQAITRGSSSFPTLAGRWRS